MRKRRNFIRIVSAALFFTASHTYGDALLMGNAERGETLHQKNCTGCHDEGMYTRENLRVQTIEGLIGQVRACNNNLNTHLSHEQLNDLVKYLNKTYYKFE